jgi:hypothetical protein
MTTQRERERERAYRAALGPAVHNPHRGDTVVYRHPAGPVEGTITSVTPQAVEVTVPRPLLQLPDLVLKFTKRQDGEYRLAGSGLSSKPALVFKEEQ